MNERIKELAREAGLLAYNPEGPPTKLEKFALLIVRDCAEVVKWTPSVFSNDTIIKNIKEHFGVEE
jgi:hypothetical protein